MSKYCRNTLIHILSLPKIRFSKINNSLVKIFVNLSQTSISILKGYKALLV